MNPFLRYLADKNSAHRQTDRHTRHTPMTTRPCGLRRAGKNYYNRTLTVQVIVEDVVTWIFFETQCIYLYTPPVATPLNWMSKEQWISFDDFQENVY